LKDFLADQHEFKNEKEFDNDVELQNGKMTRSATTKNPKNKQYLDIN